MSVTLTGLKTQVDNLIQSLTDQGKDPSTIQVVRDTNESGVMRQLGFGIEAVDAVQAGGTSIHVRVTSGGSETVVHFV
jgi:hypothetical protein